LKECNLKGKKSIPVKKETAHAGKNAGGYMKRNSEITKTECQGASAGCSWWGRSTRQSQAKNNYAKRQINCREYILAQYLYRYE
jgi:hypothetical protein